MNMSKSGTIFKYALGGEKMIYLSYIILAILVVFLSVKLSYYVDCLDKKTNLSGAFIGGVMLAAVTSLPELFTSITAVLILDQPALVQGNVLGSNVFNLCVIGGLLLFFSKGYMKAKISRTHKSTLFCGIVIYLLVFMATLRQFELPLGPINVNITSILILVVYAFNVKLMQNDDSAQTEEADDEIPFTVRQIIVRFIAYSIALVLVSILLTQVTDRIGDELQLGATVAGAIFLGVATSLPELSASINLVRMGNYNASFGNIVGSNLFNFTILCFADFIYTKGGIYFYEIQVINLIAFGIISSIAALSLIYFKKHRGVVLLSSTIILLSYITSIVLSM